MLPSGHQQIVSCSSLLSLVHVLGGYSPFEVELASQIKYIARMQTLKLARHIRPTPICRPSPLKCARGFISSLGFAGHVPADSCMPWSIQTDMTLILYECGVKARCFSTTTILRVGRRYGDGVRNLGTRASSGTCCSDEWETAMRQSGDMPGQRMCA